MNLSIILFAFAILGQTYAGICVGKCAIPSVIDDFEINKVFDFVNMRIEFKI